MFSLKTLLISLSLVVVRVVLLVVANSSVMASCGDNLIYGSYCLCAVCLVAMCHTSHLVPNKTWGTCLFMNVVILYYCFVPSPDFNSRVCNLIVTHDFLQHQECLIHNFYTFLLLFYVIIQEHRLIIAEVKLSTGSLNLI